MTQRTRHGARLYVMVGNDRSTIDSASCVRSATVVQVGPEEAIMSAAEVRQACVDGRAAVRRGKRALAGDKRAIARAKARGRSTGAPLCSLAGR